MSFRKAVLPKLIWIAPLLFLLAPLSLQPRTKAAGIRAAVDARTVRAVGTSFTPGQNGTVTLEMVSMGDENALGFSITFDITKLTYVSAVKGADAGPASMNVNTLQLAQGRLGLALAQSTGSTFTAGTRQLVVVTFSAAANATGMANIGFGDAPIGREISDINANVLDAPFVPASIPIGAPTASDAVVEGRVTSSEGAPLAGVVLQLTGTRSGRAITDANGRYHLNDIETAGFYTLTPSRANYIFSPPNLSFSQIGSRTEAAFSGSSTAVAANPLDTPEFFVRQQYVDVLEREPDSVGFNYWSDRILACGDDALCLNSRRRDVAAAFFVEQEFQRSGSFIYNVYKGSLGRQPRFSEYLNDRRQVVGGPNLDSEKQAFVAAFVQRDEFASRFENNASAESFVDAMIANVAHETSVNLASERDALITRYGMGTNQTQSRGLVLLDMIDRADVRGATYNAAFVLTEYFGYLRRDPDANGYQFWVNVLDNSDRSNYRGMVCSFITSAEYQKRFSSVVSHSNSECGQ